MNIDQFEEQLYQQIKIIIVGDSNVGKTSIVRRICSKQFPRRIVPTIGVQFESTNLQVKNKNIHVSIWDTSGQEKHNAITSQHYRKANGAIIVYDVTKKRSFLNCSKWLSQIVEKAPDNINILLLGNKIDKCQYRTSEVMMGEQFELSIREVEKEQAIKYALENGLMFTQTSAITGYNIESVFKGFVEKIVNKLGLEETNQNALLSSIGPKQPNTCCKC